MLSAEEWQRIKGSLTRREREEEEQTQALERREQRKELSQGIVQKWDNTIEVIIHVYIISDMHRALSLSRSEHQTSVYSSISLTLHRASPKTIVLPSGTTTEKAPSL